MLPGVNASYSGRRFFFITMPPLKSQKLTISIPAELAPLMARRQKEEHYHSRSAYITGLIIWDCYFRHEHKLTGALMQEPQWVRDEVLAELVADFEKLPEDKRHGGWIEKRIISLLKKKRNQGKRGKNGNGNGG
jgi:hypothetical protein